MTTKVRRCIAASAISLGFFLGAAVPGLAADDVPLWGGEQVCMAAGGHYEETRDETKCRLPNGVMIYCWKDPSTGRAGLCEVRYYWRDGSFYTRYGGHFPLIYNDGSWVSTFPSKKLGRPGSNAVPTSPVGVAPPPR